MTVARMTELSATSEQSFEDAVNRSINRAGSTPRNIEGARVKDMNVMIENGNIKDYVNFPLPSSSLSGALGRLEPATF